MADAPTTPAAKTAAPKMVQMHRAVHEIATGPKPENKIEAGTLLTDDVAKEHKLAEKDLKALTLTGAVELVDVLTA
jgi:hypothetical protein